MKTSREASTRWESIHSIKVKHRRWQSEGCRKPGAGGRIEGGVMSRPMRGEKQGQEDPTVEFSLESSSSTVKGRRTRRVKTGGPGCTLLWLGPERGVS